MTGGIAYVLDQAGDFASIRCNRTEVDLEPVTARTDIEMLHQLISRHSELTGSPQAKWILENWHEPLCRNSSRFSRTSTSAFWEFRECPRA